MSYPYGQFPGGENYSTPSTPHDAFPQWDTIEREQQELQQHQEQHQQLQQTLSASDLHSPIPGGYPQTIQLEDPPLLVPSQTHDDTPIRLHHIHQGPSSSQNKPPPPPLVMIRSGRAQQHQHAQQQAHPYRRTAASTSTTAAATRQHQQTQHYPSQQQQVTQREHHVHFAPGPASRQSGGVVASAVPSTSSARASPLVPSPSSRITSFGSSMSSPVTTNPPSSSTLLRASPRPMDPPALPQTFFPGKPKTYLIRMDTHYDTDTHVLTAVLEVPGVKREQLTVTLSTCSYNGVRQITVNGVSNPPFSVSPLINQPEGFTGTVGPNMSVRERRYGPCQRVMPVPSELKPADIEATLQDGVLLLRFPCGMPAEVDAQDILVR